MAAPEEVQMTFWDHLEVLRWSLFRVAIALFVLIVACFIAMPHIFDSFILGVVGLYVDRIFNQVKGRPLFIVAKTLNIED